MELKYVYSPIKAEVLGTNAQALNPQACGRACPTRPGWQTSTESLITLAVSSVSPTHVRSRPHLLPHPSGAEDGTPVVFLEMAKSVQRVQGAHSPWQSEHQNGLPGTHTAGVGIQPRPTNKNQNWEAESLRHSRQQCLAQNGHGAPPRPCITYTHI